jgi:putative DNA-invertase from lambdoid prophage Rac
MEQGDVLIVAKLDGLSRDAIGVSNTGVMLEALGIQVHCLALGGQDLTSSAGKLTMGVITAVAQFERDLLIEGTNAGIDRARAQGISSGDRQPSRRQSRRMCVCALRPVRTSPPLRATSASVG